MRELLSWQQTMVTLLMGCFSIQTLTGFPRTGKELSLDNRDASVLKYPPMNTNRFFTAYNFYFWFGFYFRPSARVQV